MSRSRVLVGVVAVFLLVSGALWAAPELPDGYLDVLEARHIGPVGNRVSAVSGIAGDPLTIFLGAASGGVWKSTNGGVSWKPVFDDQDVSSIGSITVAPSDRNVVWVGTGETWIRSNISIGNGIYRSTDGGESWTHLGLEESGRIGRIAVDPHDADTAFAAALGHVYGPQKVRGLWKTTDGGANWRQVLFVDEETGAIDVVIDPSNPRNVYAAMWTIEVTPWSRKSGGPGSGIWKSTDGGETFTRLEGSGLPSGLLGKIGLAIAPSEPSRIYALIETSSNPDFEPVETFQGVLWRSDDAGGSWRMVSWDNNLTQRPLYYTRAVVAPDNPHELYFAAVALWKSIDGGATKEGVVFGGDFHDIWIDPLNGDRILAAHDQGLQISHDRGESFFRPQLPIAQMYHVAVDDEVPYFVYGNRQDGMTYRGPSNTRSWGPIPIGAWSSVGGCEVGFTVPTPGASHIVWSGCYDGILERYDHRTRQARNVMVWPDAIESIAAEKLKYRFQWTFPLAISPHSSGTVYVGSQYVHRSTTGGQSWEVISPDLTSNDPDKQRRTGGLTLDDAGPTIYPTVFAIAESPRTMGEIWAGTQDGRVHVTRDNGETWTDVSPPAEPWGTVSNIEPSRHTDNVVYLTIDRHQLGDTQPWVFKTADGGASWTRIDAGIPRDTFSYTHVVREDPVRPGLLYVGTENAIHVSFDDGASWRELDVIPPAPVHWLEIQPHFNDLVVGTYGRGFWILDDITPLQQLDQAVLDTPVHLFAPRPAYRFRTVEAAVQQPGDPAAGQNPEYGATLHVHIATDLDEAPTVEILDPTGEVARTLDNVPSTAGLHRLNWNLYGEAPTEVVLRVPPELHPFIGKGEERDLSDGGGFRLLEPPGSYTVRVTVKNEDDGETVIEQKLDVVKDPHSAGTLADIAAQRDLMKRLWDLSDRAATIINEIEVYRLQIDQLEARLGDRESATEVLEAVTTLDEELKEIESLFFDLRLTGAWQDTLRWERRLYARISYLAGYSSGSDFGPTDSQLQVAALLTDELVDVERRFDETRGKVSTLNEQLVAAGLGGLVAPAAEAEEDESEDTPTR
ncbi:MAG: sialidase [Acidobacteriota bacterium]